MAAKSVHFRVGRSGLDTVHVGLMGICGNCMAMKKGANFIFLFYWKKGLDINVWSKTGKDFIEGRWEYGVGLNTMDIG